MKHDGFKGLHQRLAATAALSALMALGLGLTCQEYLDLPPGGESPAIITQGLWGDPLVSWAVVHKGETNYTAFSLSYFDSSGNLRDGALWELKSVQMRHGASRNEIDPLEQAGFEFVMTTSLDLYAWNDDEDDWERVEDNLGATSGCPFTKPPGPFDPPDDWLLLCGRRDIHRHPVAPYGGLNLGFTVDQSQGFCTGDCLVEWKHRIP